MKRLSSYSNKSDEIMRVFARNLKKHYINFWSIYSYAFSDFTRFGRGVHRYYGV